MFEKSRLFAESWNVAWRSATPGAILRDQETPFMIIKNSFRYWAADPFVFEYNAVAYVFAELYDYVLRRGIIGYCIIGGSEKPSWHPVIVEEYHLSFPNIFIDNGEIYIVPESNANNSVYLYKAVDFPDKWEKHRILRNDVRYVDTVFFRNNEKEMGLTFSIENPQSPELVLLDLDNSDMDSIIHGVDQRFRRPAGKFIESEMIRPAQNSFDDYGKGLVFYKYSMNNGEYYEKEIKRMYPEDLRLSKKIYLDGMHTYNYSEHFEVIDIKTRRFNVLNFISRIISKL